MGLDYSGKPERSFRRVLKDSLSALSETDPSFFKEDPVLDEDVLFNDLAKVLMKGAKLKEGLGNMNPAAWIPVEVGAKVISSLQRVNPSGPIDRITFGLYKEACEFITGRNSAIDEEFLLQFETVDYELGHAQTNFAHKGKSGSGGDWIGQFLEALAPMGGLMIASYLMDVGGANKPAVPTPDGENAGTQVQQQQALGTSTGLSLLIEMGMTYLVFTQLLPDANEILNEDLRSQYDELLADPALRRETLESAGYDYEALVQNQKFDDYIAIKTYCLEYIANRPLNLQYDHWIAWANVVENQEVVSGSLAMAPMFSKKWKLFSETNDTSVFSTTNETQLGPNDPQDTFEELGEDLEGAAKKGLVTGLKNYFGSVTNVSDDHYNRAAQAFSMQIDARLMCCVVWFLGPLDTKMLKKISELLRLLAMSVKVNFKDLIARLTHDALAPVISMLVAYINKIIHSVFDELLDKLLKIKDEDWSIAVSKCIGIETLFKWLEKIILELVAKITDLIKELNAFLDQINGKATALIEISAERRWMLTMAAMIDAIVDKIDAAMETCQQHEELDPQTANDLAAEAAVTFVSVELPESYPILNLSEDVRRKFFSNTKSFKTKNLEVEVPGFGPNGEIEEFSEGAATSDCGAGGRALKGILIGQKIADSINSK
jgi:hypothetical protein